MDAIVDCPEIIMPLILKGNQPSLVAVKLAFHSNKSRCKPLIDISEPDSNSKSSWLPTNVKLKFLSPNEW